MQEAAGVHPLQQQLRPVGEAAVLAEAESKAVAHAGVLVQLRRDAGLLQRDKQLRKLLRDVVAVVRAAEQEGGRRALVTFASISGVRPPGYIST